MKKASQLEILPKIEKEKNERKSRFLLALFLFLTVFPSFLFWLIAQFKEKGFFLKPKVELNFSSNFSFSKKEKETFSSKLDYWAKEKISSLPGKWAIKICLLEKDFCWGLNEKEKMVAASLIKLPVVATFYREVELGRQRLDNVYVLTESDKVAGAGSLQYQPAGTKKTFGELTTLAFSQSDNTAYRILLKIVGKEKVNEEIYRLGMKSTDLEENLTTVDDIALFFKALYKREIVENNLSQKMINDLTNTAFEDRIPAGIPDGIIVAHKIGTESGGVFSDGGIIFLPENPFVLVIMTEGISETVAKEMFPKIAKELYWLVVDYY